MGNKSIVRQLSSGYRESVEAIKATKEINRIIKRKASKKSYEAMSDDESLKKFAEEIYSELKPEYKDQIRLDFLVDLVLANKKKFLKNKKNQRKLFRANKNKK